MFRNRIGQTAEERFQEIEKTLSLENLQDIEIDAENGFLFIYTDTKKFSITLTEV